MVRNTALALLSLGCLFASPATSQDDLLASARQQFQPIPTTPPELPGNPTSPAKVELGKMLFFDPRLSASHAISCNSCHNIGLGGADAEPTSIGHRWQHGGRNAPTVLNAVFNLAQFWDGRAKDLEQQAGGPIVNPAEMASPEPHVAEQLQGTPGYRDAFAKAFPGEPELDYAWQRTKGHRRVRGDADHARRCVRPLSQGGHERSFARTERRLDAVHRSGLRKLPQRDQCWRRHVRPVRGGGETGRDHPASSG